MAAPPASVARGGKLDRVCYRTENLAAGSVLDGALADVNGDGHLDVLGLLSLKAQVVLLLSDDQGRFREHGRTSVSPRTLGIAACDVNEDGRIDLVTADHKDNAATIYFGDGRGALERHGQLRVAGSPTAIAVGDVNGDRHVDVLLSLTTAVQTFLGDGRGGFRPSQRMAAGEYPARPLLVDLDGDGDLDLVVASNDSHFVLVGDNNGSGRFREVQRIRCGRGGSDVIAADFDGKGKLGLAVSNVNSLTACVFRQRKGEWEVAGEFEGGGWSVAADDLDADGDADLLLGGATPAALRTDPHGGWGGLNFYRSEGAGEFYPFDKASLPGPANRLWVHDFDGDGQHDILGVGQRGVHVLYRGSCAAPAPLY